jgi:hypothetical protein
MFKGLFLENFAKFSQEKIKSYEIPTKIEKVELRDLNSNGKLETLVITFNEQ